MDKLDFENDQIIDIYNLHVEWQRQPWLRFKYGEAHADSVYERRQARKARNVIKAQVELEVRKNPKKFGLEKVTDSAVNATVTVDKRVIEAEERLAKAERNEKLLYHACESMNDRRETLKQETKVYSTGYWSGREVPDNVRDVSRESFRKKHFASLKENPRLQKRKR